MDEPVITTDQTSLPPPPAPPEAAPRAGWASAISMAEAGLLTDVGIVFDLAWIYVPILGTAFMPLIPAPFAILYLRRGARITLFAACVGGFLMTVLVGPHYGWRLTLEAVIGMTIGWAMQRRWPPTLAITLGLFIDATVAYVAAFVAVYALGLPLHDLYLELRNMLVGVGWLLDTSASLLGLQSSWLSVRPFFAAVAHFSLAYWIPMFYLYVTAIAAPLVVLYYSVASTTAFALGHDVRPFPSPWLWRAARVVGVILSPVVWLARLLWRLVTAPLWGPFWLARALGRHRRQRRLRGELEAADTRTQQGRLPTLPTLSEQRIASGAPCDDPLLEAAGSGREAGE